MSIKIKYQNDGNMYYFNSLKKINNYDKVVYIGCYWNNITSLPKLPNSLEYLVCSFNQLKSLPELPNSLKMLKCDNNKFIKKIKHQYLIKLFFV